MTAAKCRSFVLFVSLAGLWPGSSAAAGGEAPVRAENGTAIRDLLAQKPKEAVCFSGKFTGHKVNVWDSFKMKQVPEPGAVVNGKQVMRPEPTVYVNQDVRELTLLISREETGSDQREELHGFWLKVSMRGWRGPLYAMGNCRLRGADEPLQAPGAVAAANTPPLRCAVPCDGGSMVVKRVAGTRQVVFRFETGLRVNGSFSSASLSEGHYQVGVPAELYEDGQPRPEVPPVEFMLAPMPAKHCDAFRKVTDKLID